MDVEDLLRPAELIPSTPPELDEEAKELKSEIDKRSRIERYRIQEIAWMMYLKYMEDYHEITIILNNHLKKQREMLIKSGSVPSDFNYHEITENDLIYWLKSIKKKIEKEEEKVQRKLNRRSMDMVRVLQNTLTDINHTMGLWRDKLDDAMQRDDNEEAVAIYNLLQKDRGQMPTMIKTLSDLKTRVQTHISIDFLKTIVRRFVSIVENADTVDFTIRDRILTELRDVLHMTRMDQVDEPGRIGDG